MGIREALYVVGIVIIAVALFYFGMRWYVSRKLIGVDINTAIDFSKSNRMFVYDMAGEPLDRVVGLQVGITGGRPTYIGFVLEDDTVVVLSIKGKECQVQRRRHG